MISKTFKIKKRDFLLRKPSIIQHKLRVVLKCYTVFNFILDDNTQKFKFKKAYKINGLRMEDPKEREGEYKIEPIDEEYVSLILNI